MLAVTEHVAPPAASSCTTCAETIARKGMAHRYINGCDGCAARGIARSAAAFHAREQPEALHDVVRRVFPKARVDEAIGWVRFWWRVDHPT